MMSSACLFAAAIRIKSNSCKYPVVPMIALRYCGFLLSLTIILPRRSHPSKLGAQDTTNFLLVQASQTSLQIKFFPSYSNPLLIIVLNSTIHFHRQKVCRDCKTHFPLSKVYEFCNSIVRICHVQQNLCHESIKVFDIIRIQLFVSNVSLIFRLDGRFFLYSKYNLLAFWPLSR